MSTPFNNYIPPDGSVYATPTPATKGRGGTGAKRGRKPKAATPIVAATGADSTKPLLSQEAAGPSTPTTLTWQSTMVPAPPTSGSGGGMLSLPGTLATTASIIPPAASTQHIGPVDEDGEDELLPAMADDDYSAQLSWQSQSKDNLKYVEVAKNRVFLILHYW
jgi:transcription initiation factor TFIID subunit 11